MIGFIIIVIYHLTHVFERIGMPILPPLLNIPFSQVINEVEALASSEKAVEVISRGDPKVIHRVIHRTSTRISLTCRLVLKVHKNLFKI